jgi:tetratricopeptide (TPR) repeat protein
MWGPVRRIAFFLAVAALLGGCAHATLWEEHSEAGLSAYSDGDYEAAEEYFAAALEESERTGKVDERLATSLNNLATAYTALGRHGGSEALYSRALAIRENLFGRDDPIIATTLSSLGETYRALGRYNDAETALLRSLVIREQAFGPAHPDVAMTLNNLTALYRDQDRLQEALSAAERVVTIRQSALSPDDPCFFTCSLLDNAFQHVCHYRCSGP